MEAMFMVTRVLGCLSALIVMAATMAALVGAIGARSAGAPGPGPAIVTLGIGLCAFAWTAFGLLEFLAATRPDIMMPFSTLTMVFELLAYVTVGVGIFLLKPVRSDEEPAR